jgi:hypothetical protein
MKQVNDFIYLSSTISLDGKCKKEIIKWICQAKLHLIRKEEFTSKNIDFNIRKNLLKTYVWSIMLYGCEIWKRIEEKK